MQSPVLAVAVVALAVVIAEGQPPSTITREMVALETKLLPKIGPDTRAWITQEAVRQKTARTPGTISASSLRTVSGVSTLTSVQVNTVAFLVMMETVRSHQKDLKTAEQRYAEEKLREAQKRLESREDRERREQRFRELQEVLDRLRAAESALANLYKQVWVSAMTAIGNMK